MWKISYFLLLLIACDNWLTYESTGVEGAEFTRTNRNNDNQKYELDVDEASYEDDYNTPEESEEFQGGKLIGRWRNNGEAIEPKWRDGDSIPLVPFEEAASRRKATPKPKEKLSSNGRDIINHASSTNKYGETQDEYSRKKHTNTPSSDIKSMPEFVLPSKEIRNYGRMELHEPSHQIDYANVPRNGSRRYRTRKQKPLDSPAEKAHPAISYEREPVQHTTSHDINPKAAGNIDAVKVRFDTYNYQNPLQIHVHDYELNDEEYHRPRSRKRRPPQNYEYVETKTPYPSIDFWQKSLESSTTGRTVLPRFNNSPNESQKQSENSELKSLLKMQQVEGLSLSEILQRRNLTLGDLLKGKMEIINALKTNDEDEPGLHGPEKKTVPVQPIISPRTSSERPKWVTHRRVRIKELRRNPVQITTTYRNISKDITGNTNNKINETTKLSSGDNEGKSRDNENFSTAINQTKPIISPRLNTTRAKPVIITTTTTTTIKSTVRDPVMQYDAKKHSTTPLSVDDEEIMEFSDFAEKKYRGDSSVSVPMLSTTISKPETTTMSGRGSMVIAKYNDVDRDLGSTLSIEHILLTEPTTISTLTTTINEHDDDNKSNTLIEYNGMDNDADPYDEMEYQNDGPRNDEEQYSNNNNDELMGQMSVNFPESTKMREKNRLTTVADWNESPPLNHRPVSPDNQIYDRVVSEIEPEARAEIFELISSGASAQRLEELLKSRNMSIDELISLRQRGSSRVHLADIPRLRSRAHRYKARGDQVSAQTQIPEIKRRKSIPTTTVSPDLKDDEISTPLSIYSTLDDINAQINKINETKQRFIVVDKTPIIIKISSRTGKDDKSVTSRKDPGELVDILSAFDSLPFTVYNNYPVTSTVESITVTNNEETNESQSIKYNWEEVTGQPEITTELEFGLVKEIARETETNDEELSPTTDETYTFVPRFEDGSKTLSKVRPSIIASGAILGMTIVGFLAIFIVCRIRQKQKYMYKNTFSKAVFQAPVMNARKLSNSSSLNTIMVNVVATSTAKRSTKQETQEIEENFEVKSEIDNDSLDANDSWDTIPDFMK